MELNIPYQTFCEQVELQLAEGQTLAGKQAEIKTADDLQNLSTQISAWTTAAANLVAQAFTPADLEFAREFKITRVRRFSIGNPTKDLRQQTQETIADHQERIHLLQYYIRLVKISDSFTAAAKVAAEQRQKWTTVQVMELVLDKLFELYDDHYHSVPWILKYNGITYSERDGRALVESLEQRGYLESMHTREVTARLTLDGKMYVEGKCQAHQEDYSDLAAEPEMKQRIDEVIERLNNLGLGQEILFEELQELKVLYGKLSKKTWGQLVKGKVVDLAIGKLVENDTLKYIYEHITHHTLRLP